MKKLLLLLPIALLVAFLMVSTVLASPGAPVGRCKPGYKLELLSLHQGENPSLALNAAVDRNGDSYICAQYYFNGQHRHLDNFNRITCKKR